MRRFFIVILAAVFCLIFTGTSFGLSAQDQQSLYSDSLYYEPGSNCTSSSSTGGMLTSLTGSDNVQQIYNFFMTEGLNNAQTIGIMANLYAQSGFNPEDSYGGSVSATPTGDAWGLAQWDPGTKLAGIQQQYNVPGDIDDLLTQLNIIEQELKNTSPLGYSDLLAVIQQDSLESAASDFNNHFEGGTPQASVDADIPIVESMVKGDSGPISASSAAQASGGCAVQNIVCNTGSTSGSSDLSNIRQSVVCIAEKEYSTWSTEPLSYRATGFLPYSQGLYEEWCADFVSWVYHEANYPFNGGLNGWGYAGVSDIQQQGESNSNFKWHPLGDGYSPQPGDIAIFGSAHTAIVVSVSGGAPTLIGGDEDPSPDDVYGYPGGVASSTPHNPPSESTVNEGSLIATEPSPNSLTGYVSPSSSN